MSDPIVLLSSACQDEFHTSAPPLQAHGVVSVPPLAFLSLSCPLWARTYFVQVAAPFLWNSVYFDWSKPVLVNTFPSVGKLHRDTSAGSDVLLPWRLSGSDA
jgi:hypothetical protein